MTSALAEVKIDTNIPWWDPEDEMRRLLEILERAYSGMLGAINALVAAYFDRDPDDFVVDDATTNRVLQQAATRVVRITETTRQAIASSLQEGQARGYSNWQLAHGVPQDNFPGIDGLFKETWKNRALVVARTELQHAQLVASLQRYLASGLVDRVKIIDGCQWDDDCCKRNGTIVPIEQAPSLNHPNCLVGGQVVWAADRQAGSARWYDGEIVVLRTATNDFLSVTPDHPILTSAGWRTAGSLRHGDDVIRTGEPERMTARVAKDRHDGPTLIEQVVCSSRPSSYRSGTTAPMSSEQFNRDASKGYIDVEWADGLLLNNCVATLTEPVRQSVFLNASMQHQSHACVRSGGQDLRRIDLTKPKVTGRLSLMSSLLGRHSSLAQARGFAPGTCVPAPTPPGSNQISYVQLRARSDGQCRLASQIAVEQTTVRRSVIRHDTLGIGSNIPAETVECFAKRLGVKVDDGRDVLEGMADFIQTTRLVEVGRRQFAGYVFNLQTAPGWYVAERIVTHNCTLVIVPVLREGIAPAPQPPGAEQPALL